MHVGKNLTESEQVKNAKFQLLFPAHLFEPHFSQLPTSCKAPLLFPPPPTLRVTQFVL